MWSQGQWRGGVLLFDPLRCFMPLKFLHDVLSVMLISGTEVLYSMCIIDIFSSQLTLGEVFGRSL